MKVLHHSEVEEVKVERVQYKGKTLPVTEVGIRWLSKTGVDPQGQPEYGLRFFTVGPGGVIPVHNHFYVQTIFILSGRFECRQFDPETDRIIEKRICGPGEIVYCPPMEPHGMANISSTEEGTFLCCICNVYEDKGV